MNLLMFEREKRKMEDKIGIIKITFCGSWHGQIPEEKGEAGFRKESDPVPFSSGFTEQ